MKRLLLLAISILFLLNAYSQTYSASIHQDGRFITAYFGRNAFRDAYNAASDGQIITLSEGEYTALDGPVTKSVSIIGYGGFITSSGYETAKYTLIKNLSIEADNVKVEGIYISGTITIGACKGTSIRHCDIRTATASQLHEDTRIEQCAVGNLNILGTSKNLIVSNTTIDCMDRNAESNMATFQNCVIYTWYPNSHYAVYRNCVLGYDGYGTIYPALPSLYYNTVFTSLYRFNEDASYSNSALTTPPSLNQDGQCTFSCRTLSFTSMFGLYKSFPADPWDVPNGSDGKPVGPMGGTGFVIYPDVPRGYGTIDTKMEADKTIHVYVRAYSNNPAATGLTKYRYCWNGRFHDMQEGTMLYKNGQYYIDTNFRIPDEVIADRNYALGKCYLDLFIYDNTGACSPMVGATIFDQDPPVVTLEELPEIVNDRRLQIRWMGKDDWSGIQDYTVVIEKEQGVYSSEKKFVTTSTEYLFEEVEDGLYYIYVLARDSVGNESARGYSGQYVSFYYMDTEPPVTSFTVNNVSQGSVKASSSGAHIMWSATDNEAGVKKYNVYYSEENGPFILWKPDLTEPGAYFYGQKGHTYRIIVTATDKNENAEEIKPERAIQVIF